MSRNLAILIVGCVVGFAVGEWLAIETFIHRETRNLIREIGEYHEQHSAD